ncbi:peptidyl-prolyl cis-trans isomerase [Aquimarina sp. ERC-38]|uniref:peptidyl-prolyl cis-trans isomerase n=1 Tax=Aquimarina sp. ERC-38 TaxID=2949996 RepID=UPI00224656D0|nr:peptidyl-prolyl cis-trans isomerase [Aquimarina sp. ERC-38]UZO80423.1 peptidyl-prolyl cis-trans isomerase [Aquimarina sp. ERC-38]
MNILPYLLSILLVITLGCSSDEKVINDVPVARVNTNYLYKSALKDIVPENSSAKDSLAQVNNFIRQWATQQLFLDQSKQNLDDTTIQEFEELVEDYRNTLLITAYKNAIVDKSINMRVSDQEIASYYQENQKNFNLNKELVKLRYLHLPPGYNDMIVTQTMFDRFNTDDQEDLIRKKLEFVKFSFEDSIWIPIDRVFSLIPVLIEEEKNKILRENTYIQRKDSLGSYMIKIKEVLRKNQKAPLSYVAPTIKQIILSSRKKDLIKKIEKDITKDAIENKQFEVFN